jgi:predicted permease
MLQDARFALRVLLKSPTFTVVALLTLMLGIGTNVVVFGVMNAVLFRSLHIGDPGSLYQVRHKQWRMGRLLTTSYPALLDYQRRTRTFTGIAGVSAYSTGELGRQDTVIHVAGDEVTGNYFDLLGVQPAIGRYFHEAEEHGANSTPYLVLSDALWRKAFHADPAVIGQTVEFNKHPFTVIGVAPVTFHGAERFQWPDYWIPMANEREAEGTDYLQDRASVSVTVLGRLKPGVTPQQATDDLNEIAAELAKEYPRTDDGESLRLIHPGLIGDEGDVIRGFLWSVTGLALLVLAAACANLASLFAARAADRGRELALRVALGSSRRRLMRQLLTEAVLLSLGGGVAGLAAAALLLGALNRWPPFVSSHLMVGMDARVYFAGLLLTLGSGVLFGLIPAQQAWQSSPLQMMRCGPLDILPLRRFAVRDVLLGLQIAICTLLVTASLVAVRGMQRTLELPLGFKPHGALLASIDVGQVEENGAVAMERQKATLEAARRIPGVTAVGAVSNSRLTGGLHGVPVFRPGETDFQLRNSLLAPYAFSMSPGYLEAAGTRLLNGRDVAWTDIPSTPLVAVVNATMARSVWGNAPALGQRFVLRGKLIEVVGVTEDGKYHDLQEAPQPVLYLPSAQAGNEEEFIVVRTPRTASEMTGVLQQTFSGIAPTVTVTVRDWSESFEEAQFPARLATVSLGVMGLLAAMLAVTGIFGMAAYSVSRRMKELGIRVALGARRAQVMQAAVGRPMVLLGAGSGLGLLAGIFAGRLLGKVVYQANPRDPVVLCGAVLTMALLGMLASAIPARRALAVDPSELMREE